MSNTCAEFEGLIAAALYQELAPAERIRLDQHLQCCGSCRRELLSLERTVQRIGRPGIEPAEVEAEVFVAGVRKKLTQKTHTSHPPGTGRVMMSSSGWRPRGTKCRPMKRVAKPMMTAHSAR